MRAGVNRRATAMSNPTVIIQEMPPAIGVARAAEFAAVSRPTIRRWVREGRITAYRPNNSGSARALIDTRSLLRALGIPVEGDA